MQCPGCQATVDATARFCSSCGVSLDKQNKRSDFEIGKIAALADVKKDVITWLGTPLLIVTVATGVLGWLGLNEIVKSSVTTEVKSAVAEIKSDVNRELDRQRTTMDRELERARGSADKIAQDILTEYGKIKADQEQIHKLIKEQTGSIELTKKLITEEQNRVDMATATNKKLEEILDNTDKRRQNLERSIQDLNYAAFIGKLRYDFYHIRQYDAKATVTFAVDAHQFQSLEEDFVLMASADDHAPRAYPGFVVQMRRINGTYIGNDTHISSYEAYAPFEDYIFNRPVAELSHFDKVRFNFYGPPEAKHEIDTAANALRKIELTIRVNWVPLWKITLTKSDLVPEDSELRQSLKAGRYTAPFVSTVANTEQAVIARYEHLFEENTK